MNGNSSATTSKTTVVIMTHNYGRFLGQAIDSALTQTRSPAAIVVIDDASDDDTAAVVRPYLDRLESLRVEFRSQQKTRNVGLAHARTEYVLFLDADDFMASTMIERLEDALDLHPEARIAYCDKWVFGNEQAMRTMNLAPRWSAGPFSLEVLRFKNFIMATSLIRRDCIDAFDERIVRLTDWDTWLGMLHDAKHAVYVPEPLLHYRVHGENVSVHRKELIERLKILVKHGLLQDAGGDKPPARRNGAHVAILTTGAGHTTPAIWNELALRHGWTLRVLVGLPEEAGNKLVPDAIIRSKHCIIQTAATADIDALLRHFIGVVTDTSIDAVIIAADPTGIPESFGHFDAKAFAWKGVKSERELLSTGNLESLDLFALSPAAIRLLMYVKPSPRQTPLDRFKQATTAFFSMHIGWRLKRLRALAGDRA